MLLLVSEPGVVEKLTEPALGVVAQTTLGAVTLVALAIMVLSVWKLSSTQDRRAADAKEATERYTKVTEKMFVFQSEVNRTLEHLVKAEETSDQVSREQTILLNQIKTSIDTTIRDAVLRRPTPNPGIPKPQGRY